MDDLMERLQIKIGVKLLERLAYDYEQLDLLYLDSDLNPNHKEANDARIKEIEQEVAELEKFFSQVLQWTFFLEFKMEPNHQNYKDVNEVVNKNDLKEGRLYMNNTTDFGEIGKMLILAGIATCIAGQAGLIVVIGCYVLKKFLSK